MFSTCVENNNTLLVLDIPVFTQMAAAWMATFDSICRGLILIQVLLLIQCSPQLDGVEGFAVS
jgi:hypothetical protein